MGKPRQQAYGGDLLHLVHDSCVAVDQIAIGDPAMSNCRDDMKEGCTPMSVQEMPLGCRMQSMPDEPIDAAG